MTIILGGGGDAAPIPTAQFVIGESKTFTAPKTGRIKVIITGGGGQGAFLHNTSSTLRNNQGDATGGGAGGYSEKTFNVTAGETFTVTIGSGGATTLSMDSINSNRVGNNGGNSSFVTVSAAESVNMVANGGGGGQFSASTSSAVTTAGGTGGTASGGDFNYTGGAGGSISRVADCPNNAVTTGGGAVALYGTAYRGGNVTITGALGTSHKGMGTGGAGIGGQGGDIIETGGGYSVIHRSTGGSASRSGFSDSTSGNAWVGNTLLTAGSPFEDPTISVIDAQGYGGYSRYAYNASVYAGTGSYGGGGGAAIGRLTQSYAFEGGGAGGFAGSGSLNMFGGYYSGNAYIGTRAGGNGGGGSGAFSSSFSTSTSATNRNWGPGGDGLCIIMFV